MYRQGLRYTESMYKFFLRWGPVLVWMIVIFVFSSKQSISVSDRQVTNFLFFKTLHLIEYAILYAFSFRAFHMSFPSSPKKHHLFAAFELTIVYALTDELHQLFVPSRGGKLQDVIIDAIGASGAWFFLLYVLPILPKKLKALAKSWHFS